VVNVLRIPALPFWVVKDNMVVSLLCFPFLSTPLEFYQVFVWGAFPHIDPYSTLLLRCFLGGSIPLRPRLFPGAGRWRLCLAAPHSHLPDFLRFSLYGFRMGPGGLTVFLLRCLLQCARIVYVSLPKGSFFSVLLPVRSCFGSVKRGSRSSARWHRQG